MLETTTMILPCSNVAHVLSTTGHIAVFFRLLHKKQLFYSAHYGCVKTRNSYTISFVTEVEGEMFRQIQYFTVLNSSPVAVVRVLKVQQSLFHKCRPQNTSGLYVQYLQSYYSMLN